MRFILALVPPKSAFFPYIQAAQLMFGPAQDGYLLSDHSLPHITVCQFDCESEQEAMGVWQKFADLEIPSHQVRFTGVSYIKDTTSENNLYWAELSIERDETLMLIHEFAVKMLQNQGYACVNKIRNLYRPHLTLARFKLPLYMQAWPERILDNSVVFTFSLGLGDQNGQYLKILAQKKEGT